MDCEEGLEELSKKRYVFYTCITQDGLGFLRDTGFFG